MNEKIFIKKEIEAVNELAIEYMKYQPEPNSLAGFIGWINRLEDRLNK